MRVACLNNYPLQKMLDRARSGEAPAQHCWGVDVGERSGWAMMIAPFHEPAESNPLEYLSRRTRTAFGQLDQELWALRQNADVYFAADQRSLRGIALAGVPGRKVSIIHHPVRLRRVNRRVLRGQDALICLSSRLVDELIAAGFERDKLSLGRWGPDTASPVYAGAVDSGEIVSGGKSNRDIDTLVRAMTIARRSGIVYDLASTVRSAPPGVQLVRPGGAGADPASSNGYLPNHVYAHLRSAAVIAIPVKDPNRLTGLTEVNDAMAFGKPVIVTRSPYLPIDVDRVGCGISVDPGDVKGWVNALNELADPGARKQMGENGRQYASSYWNYDSFGTDLTATVERVANMRS